jgi:paraquat-inducible protein B
MARSKSRWVSVCLWLIPILMALISIGLVAGQVAEQGPQITVSFLDADGIEPGRTPVKYNDVEVGVVTAIGLSADRNRVLATVRLTKAAGDLAVQDSRFWIVRPRADARGVSGFGALLSGAYIGADAGHVRETRNTFIGLEVPPVVTAARQGASYVLRSGSLGSITGRPSTIAMWRLDG